MASPCSVWSLSSIILTMDQKPEDSSDYDIFRQESVGLEVAEENTAPKMIKLPAAPNRNRWSKKRIIFTLLAVIAVLALLTAVILYIRSSSKPEPTVVINTQSLDNGTLNQLTTENGAADGKQQLTITPDTLFHNNVTINKDLLVNGRTTLQSALNVARDLAVGGNTTVGGNLSVTGQISAGNLNVGTVSMGTLQISGNLELRGHIVPTGPVPTIKTSVAAAGGTARIDGTDTAGTITIVMAGAVPAGEMVIVTFNTAFNATPKLQLTPVSNAAAKLDYFATKTAGFFTIEAASLPTPGSTYIFDYFVTQ